MNKVNKIVKTLAIPVAMIVFISGVTIVSNMSKEELPVENSVVKTVEVEEVKQEEPVEVEAVAPVEEVINEQKVPVSIEYLAPGSLFVEVGTRLKKTGMIQELHSLRFSENSVYSAITKAQYANPEIITSENLNEKIDTCAKQVIEAIESSLEAGLPFDYRTFTCSI